MPNGRLVGMVTAPVEPWPHQAVVARRLIESWPYSFLLCDEVGLGKTIEAGLALRSLILSGLARRVLIAPPASLAKQWNNELKDKFYLPFARALNGAQPRHKVIHPTERQFPSKSVFAPDLAIVSTGLVRRNRQVGRHSPRARRAGPGHGRAQARGRARRACAQGDPCRAAPAAHRRRARHHRPSRPAANHRGLKTRFIPEKDNRVVP
jgi:hypothetical protein